jgi:hypothetical protein
MQLPDIIKSSRVLVIKLKKEWRKGRKRGKTENLGSRQKRKGWFSRWRYGRSRCRLCWRYTRNRRLHEALENELNKQGLGGSGQNALEKMKEIEKQILNKGFKNETLQKILNVKQELLKLNSAVQQRGRKEATIGEQQKRV